jgi:hypothetical protein
MIVKSLKFFSRSLSNFFADIIYGNTLRQLYRVSLRTFNQIDNKREIFVQKLKFTQKRLTKIGGFTLRGAVNITACKRITLVSVN